MTVIISDLHADRGSAQSERYLFRAVDSAELGDLENRLGRFETAPGTLEGKLFRLTEDDAVRTAWGITRLDHAEDRFIVRVRLTGLPEHQTLETDGMDTVWISSEHLGRFNEMIETWTVLGRVSRTTGEGRGSHG